MSDLKQFSNLDINWDLSPEDAVTLYLEWGNNNWHGQHPPVRDKSDVAYYFVVDTWEARPIVRLVERNSEDSRDLISLELPLELENLWYKEYGKLKAVFEPLPQIKDWLKQELGH